MRGILSIRHVPTSAFDYGWENCGRNKRSIGIDLKKEAGSKILYDLIEGADVFLTNYQLPRLKGMQIDYESLARINPSLVYVYGTVWGPAGPRRDKRADD